MTLDEFTTLVKNHDWYYNFSDDHGVWVRGERESAKIDAALKNGTDDMKRVYNDYHALHYNTPSFVTKDRPYVAPFPLV
jgi:hypothetical protein